MSKNPKRTQATAAGCGFKKEDPNSEGKIRKKTQNPHTDVRAFVFRLNAPRVGGKRQVRTISSNTPSDSNGFDHHSLQLLFLVIPTYRVPPKRTYRPNAPV